MAFNSSHAALNLASALLALCCLAGRPAQAQAVAPPPAKVEQLLGLLDDPEVKTWLAGQKAAKAKPEGDEAAVADQISTVESYVRARITAMVQAVPRLPSEFQRAVNILVTDVNSGRRGAVTAILLVLVAVGYAAEWLFRRLMIARRRPTELQAEHNMRLLTEPIPLLVFAVASAGLFLMFSWPPLLRRFVLTLLCAFIAFRVVRTIAFMLLRPKGGHGEPTRLVEVNDASAAFWFLRVQLFAGLFLFGWAVVSLMPTLGFSPGARGLIGYALGLGLLAIGIETVWRRPDAQRTGAFGHARAWLTSVLLALLWMVWVAGLNGLLWLGIYALILPPAVRGVGAIAARVGGREHSKSLGNVIANVLIVRGARAVVIGVAVAWLAYIFRETTTMIGNSASVERVIQGVLNGIIVLLIADLIWQLAKAYIEFRLELTGHGSSADELARNGRLRTLLPIFRNALAVFIAVVAVLTILAGLGIQIMPLIAGAGIFGVAIGFGSQTLVKDILSGVFYMLDDAFRVGEYIQSGSYKGTVESFSLRSVRLRHHRGPVFTVPFGTLGAVQNMSRDWVMEKITMSVTYDSDVELARKLIKKIGQELAEDPEFAASTIQPLKMQGIDSFGDSGIVLTMKLMTKPGEQFGIKRRAYVMIKKAFDENGIKLATPTVQVAGGEENATAAAGDILRRRRAKAAQEALAAAG